MGKLWNSSEMCTADFPRGPQWNLTPDADGGHFGSMLLMPPILWLNFPFLLFVLPEIPPYIQILVSESASGEHQPKTNLSSVHEEDNVSPKQTPPAFKC